MSASLVGSEMCIRDSRASASARSAGRGLCWQPPWHSAWRSGARAGRPGSCLLYTSDAADDM
eukprot:6070741-Alexandrium_andersonii.AAC.1